MNTKSESALVVERVLDADPGSVFEALTKPEIMSQWFHPGKEGWSARIVADPRIDGTYELHMHAPDGETYTHTGKYVEFDPPRKVAFTWNTRSVKDTLVSIELRAQGKRTLLTLTHEFLPADQVEGHRKGWTECFENLNDTVK